MPGNEIPSNMSRIVLIHGRRTCWCQEGQLLPPLISMVNKQNIALQRPGRPSITTAPPYFVTFQRSAAGRSCHFWGPVMTLTPAT